MYMYIYIYMSVRSETYVENTQRPIISRSQRTLSAFSETSFTSSLLRIAFDQMAERSLRRSPLAGQQLDGRPSRPAGQLRAEPLGQTAGAGPFCETIPPTLLY